VVPLRNTPARCHAPSRKELSKHVYCESPCHSIWEIADHPARRRIKWPQEQIHYLRKLPSGCRIRLDRRHRTIEVLIWVSFAAWNFTNQNTRIVNRTSFFCFPAPCPLLADSFSASFGISVRSRPRASFQRRIFLDLNGYRCWDFSSGTMSDLMAAIGTISAFLNAALKTGRSSP